MSLYENALDATEQHLRNLQSNGVRFLNIRAGTLMELQQPVAAKVAETVVEKAEVAAISVGADIEGTGLSAGTALSRSLPASAEREEENRLKPGLRADLGGAGEMVAAPVRPDKAGAMAALRERALACVKCPNLVAARHSVVFGVGDINARLMFVGEAPGADEDQQGEPFVGAAGQLLTRIIKAMGFSRETVYIANILKCRPDTPGQTSGNRKPTPAEMQTCIPWLQEQIDLIQPVVIVALGGVAVEGLLGKGEGISRLRGHYQTYRGIPVMPTFHPSYLLRNQAITEKRKVWEDMLQVLEKLGATITEKQRGYFLKA